METWLILATNSLTDNIQNQPTKSYFKNILCLLTIYFKLNMLDDFCRKAEHTTHIGILLRNLTVDSSSVLKAEVKSFWNNYGQTFQELLVNFINKVIHFHPTMIEWIFAVPLVHMLMRKHNNLNNVEWKDDPSCFM